MLLNVMNKFVEAYENQLIGFGLFKIQPFISSSSFSPVGVSGVASFFSHIFLCNSLKPLKPKQKNFCLINGCVIVMLFIELYGKESMGEMSNRWMQKSAMEKNAFATCARQHRTHQTDDAKQCIPIPCTKFNIRHFVSPKEHRIIKESNIHRNWNQR